MRPAEYEDEPDTAAGAGDVEGTDGAAAEKKDPANGLPSCSATELPAEVERIQNEGQTVLVLDPSEEQVVISDQI